MPSDSSCYQRKDVCSHQAKCSLATQNPQVIEVVAQTPHSPLSCHWWQWTATNSSIRLLVRRNMMGKSVSHGLECHSWFRSHLSHKLAWCHRKPLLTLPQPSLLISGRDFQYSKIAVATDKTQSRRWPVEMHLQTVWICIHNSSQTWKAEWSHRCSQQWK